ncbi:MAG: LysM peptidoglycan-binding domain-containing protein [Anaerolineae bacterium]|nr:LysM peptidoglycan-binding domain-containing protein [Anaerolineae bacterium]
MRLWMFLLVLLPGSLLALPAQAQTNLLQNGSLDGQYGGIGTPAGWQGWFTNSPRTETWMNVDPFFFPHTADFKRSGNASQNIGRNGGTFTAAIWQRVDGIAQGTALRATAWVYLENASASGAAAYVGIGSNTTDPANPAITWSPAMTAVNSWQQVTVDAVVPAGSVTVFVYSDQRFPNGPEGPNQMYIEDVSLVATGTGAVPTAAGGAVPAATSVPVRPQAAFVNAQDTDASDGITHTVRSGDTLAAIAVAYGTTSSRLRELNNLQGGFLQIGQVIIIATPEAAPAGEATTAPATAAEQSAPPNTPAAVAAQATSVPPTAIPPTDIPSTAIPPTDIPPTATPSPEVSPTPTDIPPTATPAATAVVTAGATGNPVTREAGVCVVLFDDQNQNRLQGSTEPALAGGSIALVDRSGATLDTRTTTADGEPACFLEVLPGTYSLTATAPAGYGLTTPPVLSVSVQAGTQFQISFGAAAGVTAATAPTPDNPTTPATADAPATPEASRGMLGILFVGLAGVVLVGGLILAVIIRRL